jgi:plastocyanin
MIRRLRACLAAAMFCGLLVLGATVDLALAAPVSRGARAGHATKRHACTKHARHSSRHKRRCHTRHRRAAKKAPTPVSMLPAASTLTTAVEPQSLLAPAPDLAPNAASSSPGPEPTEVVAPPEAPAEPPSIPHVQVSAVEYSFSLSRTTVPAGKVVLQFVNAGQDEHNLHIDPAEGPPEEAFANTPSKGMADLQLEMQPGTYTLFCSLPTHEQKGMKATLVVE